MKKKKPWSCTWKTTIHAYPSWHKFECQYINLIKKWTTSAAATVAKANNEVFNGCANNVSNENDALTGLNWIRGVNWNVCLCDYLRINRQRNELKGTTNVQIRVAENPISACEWVSYGKDWQRGRDWRPNFVS